jgi:hypothetical protein
LPTLYSKIQQNAIGKRGLFQDFLSKLTKHSGYTNILTKRRGRLIQPARNIWIFVYGTAAVKAVIFSEEGF